ncbi:TrxA Thiol-disulfide isomerase and thioredoxins [uncultured Caudovirales phage]|uniref:TrxA Thiol-disulfide isomerase and thioredoxins n=1 Tax=uncultured Caudovirales phage TaxID=2100421 RepID=A0A6J5NFU9_9CAUD|nr:TrxA Thiol-disulfide isomerase and thioredoxins [uncultured Caudovirales phage]
MGNVLYFTADWCNPCKKVKPIVEGINKDSITKFQIIDVDSEIELVKRFEIRSVPTFILMDDGKEVARLIGAQNKESLLDFIKIGLDSDNG